MILFLTGFMGCGKSTIARRLAERLGWDFLDLDAETERRGGATVPEVFDSAGEEGFRRLESETLKAVVAEYSGRNLVVAAGGGTPCREENLDVMKEAGMTVYLRMSPAKLLRRLERSRTRRPMLAGIAGDGLKDYVENLLVLREPFYMRANMALDCDGANDDYIIGHILTFLEYAPAMRPEI